MARWLFAVLMVTASLTLASGARAVPMFSLHPDNVGISEFMIDGIVGNTITITETWTSTDPGIYLVTGLDDDVTYTIQRNVINHSGATWMDFEIELFDPPGQPLDDDDAAAPLDICMTNCTPGSLDGLVMGVESLIMSDVFDFDYETTFGPLQGKILTFFDGTVPNTSDFFIQHGLVDFNAEFPWPGQDSENQPFALFARLTTFEANEAAPLLLMALTFGALLLGSGGGGGPRLAI